MNLVKSTGTFGFYTIISRLLGYLRDILIAIFLGASSFADVFFIAFTGAATPGEYASARSLLVVIVFEDTISIFPGFLWL